MFDSYTQVLLQRHAGREAVIDANLLFLWCVGVCDRRLVSNAKGTKEYTLRDFELLSSILGNFASFRVTPNILTEVSNLACRLADRVREEIHLIVHELPNLSLADVTEHYIPTSAASQQQCFSRLGLTDSTVAELSPGILVLTNDLDLSLYLESQSIDCIHYDRMLRPYALAT